MTDIIHAAGTAAVEIFRRDLIATMQRSIEANRRLLQTLSRTLLGAGYVVRSSHGIVVDFEVDADGRVTAPRAQSPGAARRFTLADAQHLAQACHDGTGQPFEAIHVRDALADAIAADERLIAELQAAAKTTLQEGA